MAGYNRIIMVGNLTRDPELRTVGAQSVCKLTIASNRQYKNRQTGAMVQEVCFIDVDVWGAQADTCKTYLQKGRMVLVEGRLKQDTWKDTEGNTRTKYSIVAERIIFLGAGDSQSEDVSDDMQSLVDSNARQLLEPASSAAQKTRKPAAAGSFKDKPAFEDDLPF